MPRRGDAAIALCVAVAAVFAYTRWWSSTVVAEVSGAKPPCNWCDRLQPTLGASARIITPPGFASRDRSGCGGASQCGLACVSCECEGCGSHRAIARWVPPKEHPNHHQDQQQQQQQQHRARSQAKRFSSSEVSEKEYHSMATAAARSAPAAPAPKATDPVLTTKPYCNCKHRRRLLTSTLHARPRHTPLLA